jgi:hypothetical protein
VNGDLEYHRIRLQAEGRVELDLSPKSTHLPGASPEQLRGQPADTRSDVFAAASLAYHIVTGRQPFGGRTLHALACSIANEEPPDARTLDPWVSASLAAWLQRGLAKDPAARFADCGDMLETLRRLGGRDATGSPGAAGGTQESQTAPAPAGARNGGSPVDAEVGAVPPECWKVFDDVRRVAIGLLSETRDLLPMYFRLEGGRAVHADTSDLPRVHGVRQVRGQADHRGDSAVAFVWDRLPDGSTGALAIEVRLTGMEAPIRYLQRYRLGEKGQPATELGPPMLVGKCSWGRHGEDEPAFPPLRCPVCTAEMRDSTPRYPYRVCGTCVGKAQSADGRPLRFSNAGVGGGFDATFADTGKAYPSHECFIAGVRGEANEAHFGGIVVEVGPAWLVYRDADGMHSILLRAPSGVIIGRDSKLCGIAVKDFGLSKQHARINVTLDGRMALTDLRSKGGSQVNGRPVVEAPVSTGDTLRLGTVDFSIVAAPLLIDAGSD